MERRQRREGTSHLHILKLGHRRFPKSRPPFVKYHNIPLNHLTQADDTEIWKQI